MVITNKFRAPVGIRDLVIAEKPIDYVIHYLKSTSGVPSGGGAIDEYCLNIIDNVLYSYDGGSWNGTPLTINQRFCFCGNGITGSGNGSNIPDQYLYDFDGINCSSKQAPDGIVVLIKKKSLDFSKESLITYDKTHNNWIKSSTSSSSTTDEDIDDRVANLLQEGEAIDLSYNDALNTLTVSCELAESGNSSVNKGVASFNSDSFSVTSGHVDITNINGGNF